MSNLRLSLVGLVSKNAGGWRLITHLSYPIWLDVNEYIKGKFIHVKYPSVDDAVSFIALKTYM